MRSVVFLFPGSGPYEALDGWVRALGRHARDFNVDLARHTGECRGFDVAFVLTEARTYPREKIDHDLGVLYNLGIPFGVVHNHDNPPVPSWERFPSFCWTRAGWRRLTAHHFEPHLVRQPLFPPLAVPRRDGTPTLLCTFGSVEPKKHTLQMARWCQKHHLPFLALGPQELACEYADYVKVLRAYGAAVRLYPWQPNVEDLAPYVADATHFLFVLPPAKGGSGGSPTSPRYAGFWGRPVIVVDDEDTFCEDGFHVYKRLDDIPVDLLGRLGGPRYDWGPDEYLSALVEKTLAFWGK